MQPEEEDEEEDDEDKLEYEIEEEDEDMDEESIRVHRGPFLVQEVGHTGPSIFGLKRVTAALKERERERERNTLGGKSPRSMSGISGQHPNPPLILVSIRE